MPAPDQSQVHELLIERPPIAITATLGSVWEVRADTCSGENGESYR